MLMLKQSDRIILKCGFNYTQMEENKSNYTSCGDGVIQGWQIHRLYDICGLGAFPPATADTPQSSMMCNHCPDRPTVAVQQRTQPSKSN